MSAAQFHCETPPAIPTGSEPVAAQPRWLPRVRYHHNRWWLPLSLQSADVLAAALMRHPSDTRSLAAIERRLRVDPPLQIFAALATCECAPLPQQPLTITALAQRLSNQLLSLLTHGERALGAPDIVNPEVTNQHGRFASWTQLHQRFIKLPHTQWLTAAADWLELTGPAVPAAWQQSWPRLVDDTAPIQGVQPEATTYGPSELDLAALARTLSRSQMLENRFTDAVHQAKRAALKQFAYGLSHEINNPLANISTRAQSLLRDESDPNRVKTLQRIVDQTMRAHEMVADLMFYAHPPAPSKRSVELLAILRSAVGQLHESIEGRGIELLILPSAQQLTVIADQHMLLEAVRSLVRNSIEAIGCDGRVELTCYQEKSTDSAADSLPSRVVIVVRDSGPGLSETAQRHAFDPYFSGREAGRGLGVGLCRVERIAQLHDGDVSLQTGPAGCIAKLWFPQTS